VIENRNGLVVGCQATEANGFAERDSAVELLAHVARLKNATAGADSTGAPHDSADNRASQIARKRVEHPFGWIKSVAGLFQLSHRGLPKVDWVFSFATVAYNPTRLRLLIPAPMPA
jgi:hypothetical protein